MNKRQKIVQEAFLDNEEAVIDLLDSTYTKAQKDIEKKIKSLQKQIDQLDSLYETIEDEEARKKILSQQRSKVYQKQYQDSLKNQVSDILDKMHDEEFETVSEYLTQCYEEGFLGTMYDLHGQGIPLIFPIDQEAIVRAVQLDSKISKGLYKRLGEDVTLLKKNIASEISRGISTGASYSQIALQIKAKMTGIYDKKSGGALFRAETIAVTEGHRIQVQSGMDACYKAQENGADVLKQWDATLDGATRPSHRKVDGEIRELDEPFSNGLMHPGDPAGGAAEVIRCRCALLQRARWALDEDELKTLKERAKFFDLDKNDSFEDFKKKYLKAVDEIQTIDSINSKGQKVLADAYEKHRIKNNMTSVPYDELGDSASDIISVDYGKMSVESAKAFDDTINKLVNEYDTPIQKIRTMTREEFMSNGDAFAYVSHNYTVDSAELVINPTKCKDIDKMKERIKELSGYGYCVKIPDEVAEQYIATHEFAHTLINLEQPLKKKTNWLNADYEKIKKARKEINAVYDEYMEEVERLTKAREEAEFLALTEVTDENWLEAEKAIDALDAVKLSDYSLESADEFMAEAFVNEKIGTSSNKYSKKVVDILDKYFKG